MTPRTVELYFNESDGSRFWSYQPEAEMRCGERREMDLPADDFEALQEVWFFFNRDDRPNGDYERSLSMGDVITLDRAKSYAATGVSFREVDTLTGYPLITSLEWNRPRHRVRVPGRFGY